MVGVEKEEIEKKIYKDEKKEVENEDWEDEAIENAETTKI